MKEGLSSNASLGLTIAGLTFQIQCPDRELLVQLADHYVDFLKPVDRPDDLLGAADIHAVVEVVKRSGGLDDLSRYISFGDGLLRVGGPDAEGFIDGASGRAELCFSSQHAFEITDYFLRVALAVAAFRAGGLMLHAAGIVHKGKAHLFFGHSGSGKTTVARLSDGGKVLNDDLVVLMPADGAWQAHATPFWNPSQVRPSAGQARLVSFYRLVQDKRVFIQQMQTSQAVAELISNVPVLSADPNCSLDLLDRVQALAQNYPVVHLHFLPDSTFWQVIDATEDLPANQI